MHSRYAQQPNPFLLQSEPARDLSKHITRPISRANEAQRTERQLDGLVSRFHFRGYRFSGGIDLIAAANRA
jgi:hypothetical protein